MARDDYDSPWKEALVKYLPRFFEFFFHHIFDDVDWTQKTRFLDKELQAIAPRRNKKAGPRVVDSLVELPRISAPPAWVLVHIEVQAQKVDQFEKRMFLYHARILERYDKRVCSLAVLADSNPRWRPSSFHESLWETEIEFRFPGAKLTDFREELPELEKSSNPFGILVASTLHAHSTKQSSNSRRMAKTRMVKQLFKSGLGKKEIQEFFKLVDWVLQLSPEQTTIFDEELIELERETNMPYITSIERKGLEKGRAEGLEKGLEKGRTEGRLAALLDALDARFGEVPESLKEKLEDLSDQQRLRELFRLAVTAETLEEFQEEL
jgi:hypothetical protein